MEIYRVKRRNPDVFLRAAKGFKVLFRRDDSMRVKQTALRQPKARPAVWADKTAADEPGGELRVVRIQRTCVHDGPGLRTTVFFRGCALNCLWCQNPETLSFEAAGEEVLTPAQVAQTVLKDSKYYFSSGGGVTLSGGEPLLQKPEALVRLLKILKNKGIHTAVETGLHVPWSTVEAVLPFVDLFFVDIKTAGDALLHEKLTGQNGVLIAENIKRLAAAKAEIRLRMVVVPGYNDSPESIERVAAFAKSIGHHRIELLKYHNMYEDKAKRLGLERPRLDISPEQSAAAALAAAEVFARCGIEAVDGDPDTTIKPAEFTQRVMEIRNAIHESDRTLCLDVAKLKTKFYKKNGFQDPVHIHRAKRLDYVLKNKAIKVYPGELLVGNFTANRVGGQLWEEQYGALAVSFIHKLNRQKPVSFRIGLKDRLYFYFFIFPFWVKKGIFGRVNSKFSILLDMVARTSEMIAGFNNNFAAIAHFIVNFDRMLELGTTGIIAEIEAAKREHPGNNPDFYDGAVIALHALEAFAERYAVLLEQMSAREKDPARQKELADMAEVCRHVPKNPARTFREAMQCITFLQIALCIEAYENAVSFGRLDQVLYPYYKRDLDAGLITYDEAKELICLFILKMDEAILVNDGDSYLNVAKLFETLSTDQALTFGGVDKQGRDATNDLTYMLVDACELQPLAVNMCARIHKGSPQKYLERLAEIYINGCPMPELFSDEIYIPSILSHYDTTLAQARNYAIVGCVEPNASDDHFGNTDCANMNLALPLLQALKGQEHDLWHMDKKQRNEKLVTKFLEYSVKGTNPLSRAVIRRHNRKVERFKLVRGLFDLKPPADMEELLSRFETRLGVLANGVLADHQKIEAVLRRYFTTPLASSLFKGCVRRGLDAYEGGADFNSSGIQAIGVTDVADSLYALDEVVFKQKKYNLIEVINAIDANFEGEKNQQIRADLLAVPKFGDDTSEKASEWVTRVMEIYNRVLASVEGCPRGGIYTAGYYALNVNDRYGKKTQALPSGRLKGVPLANSVAPHYAMEKADLLSSLNSVGAVDFTDFAPNGTTLTFTIDAALFKGLEGVKNLAAIFKTYLTEGGMQFQPNVINRQILIDAYNHPEKYKFLMVRVAGYCAYFNELSDELKLIIINRTCYA